MIYYILLYLSVEFLSYRFSCFDRNRTRTVQLFLVINVNRTTIINAFTATSGGDYKSIYNFERKKGLRTSFVVYVCGLRVFVFVPRNRFGKKYFFLFFVSYNLLLSRVRLVTLTRCVLQSGKPYKFIGPQSF